MENASARQTQDSPGSLPALHTVPDTNWIATIGKPVQRRTEFRSQLHFEVPSVYLQPVSRPFELSLQSSLQLSLTVLVCYRYHQNI